jgi:putative membrane protein
MRVLPNALVPPSRISMYLSMRFAPRTADFVTEAAQSDMFEIQSSTLAASRTTGDVQAFANQMVTDHTKTTNDLKGLVPKTRASLPTGHEQFPAGYARKAKRAHRR